MIWPITKTFDEVLYDWYEDHGWVRLVPERRMCRRLGNKIGYVIWKKRPNQRQRPEKAIQPAEGKPLGPGIRHRNVEWRKPIILYPKSYAVTWVRTKAGSRYTEADISGMGKSTP